MKQSILDFSIHCIVETFRWVMKVLKIVKNILTMYYVREMIFISPCKKTIRKLSVYSVVFLSALIICSLINYLINSNYYQILQRHGSRFQTDLKYILIWTPQRTAYRYNLNANKKSLTGQRIFIRQKCSYLNCYISYDNNLLKEDHRNFDAVVFKVKDIINFIATDMNVTRSPNQIYIFNSLDSSEMYPICNPVFDNFFNWTWTYKLNSEIPHPFFNIYDVNNEIIGPKTFINWTKKMDHSDKYKSRMREKSKAVAWIVTECRLKVRHQEFISEFKNELKGYNYTLDIYGPCGDKKCPKRSKNNCYKIIEKQYFFQMVLEDTFAEDYITERMVRAMTHIAIPIVLGGSNYNRFLPPGSYINAQSFNMKKLGAIIDYLIKNPVTYEYFFDWKNHYYYMARPRSFMCDLCTKLNLYNTSKSTEKLYPKFRNWWNPNYKEYCQGMQFINKAF